MRGGGSKANKTVVNSSKNNKSKNLTYIPNIKTMGESTFITLNTKKVFNYLR